MSHESIARRYIAGQSIVRYAEVLETAKPQSKNRHSLSGNLFARLSVEFIHRGALAQQQPRAESKQGSGKLF
jgi:hypothetical protein